METRGCAECVHPAWGGASCVKGPFSQVYIFCCVSYAGTYAEYACVSEEHLARMPEGMTYEDAASVCNSALTAYQVPVGCTKLLGGCHDHRWYQSKLASLAPIMIRTTACIGAHQLCQHSFGLTSYQTSTGSSSDIPCFGRVACMR